MIRNALAKELGDAVGMPYTPGYQFVDLYVNDEYMGTYQLTDRVKAEDGRSLVSGGNKDADWQIQFDDKTEIKENDNAVYIDQIANAPKKWNALADAGLLSTLKEKSIAISATLAQTQPKNAERWSNSLGDFSTYSASVSAIGTYLDKRFEYLDKKFNELAYDEVTVSTLTHVIELLKQGKLTEADINAIVDRLLERK